MARLSIFLFCIFCVSGTLVLADDGRDIDAGFGEWKVLFDGKSTKGGKGAEPQQPCSEWLLRTSWSDKPLEQYAQRLPKRLREGLAAKPSHAALEAALRVRRRRLVLAHRFLARRVLANRMLARTPWRFL